LPLALSFFLLSLTREGRKRANKSRANTMN
jgi:hypothetical protein